MRAKRQKLEHQFQEPEETKRLVAEAERAVKEAEKAGEAARRARELKDAEIPDLAKAAEEGKKEVTKLRDQMEGARQ